MSDFRFANPDWSAALWLVAALLALLVWLDWRRSDVLARFLSATMQRRLVHRLSRTRRWLSIGLLGLAASSLVVALMRPQWGLTYYETPRVGAQIMVCVDVSKSMLAEDTAPNRLGRAKAELEDLLSYLDGDQVGLIAFAGRAAVLCPLTPDFGFFRLVLESAGPHSVGRGGTRLEEPIRKALEGFRGEADVSRIILLITDGEDHDSHPLDAAKAAAERGIKVLAIGFGDEAGSEIQTTDPRTGVRSVLRDAAGAAVVSRLDGQMLRDIALQTEGAYIPAGTGALDLKSIYDAHIAPLVRGRLDDRGRAVRREGFQWAILCGLVFLASAIAAGSGSVRSELAGASREPRRARAKAEIAALAIALALAAAGGAAEPPSGQGSPADAVDPVAAAAPSDATARKKDAPELEEKAPRDLYNEALASLDSDSDRAEQLLTEARHRSGGDGEVRFRATYNMGWVEVKRADQTIGEKPQEALAHLRRAADWFRDSVRLRPEHADARHNLEVVLRRITELADSLARPEDRDLAQRLNALIEAQRSVVAAARGIAERAGAEDAADDALRGEFRQLAVRQRQVLSDCQALSSAAREESDAVQAKSDKEQTSEENLRAAQLAGVLQYTGRAEQRMGQARSQMRLRQADRAFRRTAAALDELKRAGDQLRNPVEILDVVLADAVSLAGLTSLKATAEAVPGEKPQSVPPPAWLTGEYLGESQLAVTERTAELAARLQAGVDTENPPGQSPPGNQGEQKAQSDRFLAMVRQAMPFLTKGKEAFEAAGEALAKQEFQLARERQVEAIDALGDARERFLQLRGLIELSYARQAQIQSLLSPQEGASAEREPDNGKPEKDKPAPEVNPVEEASGQPGIDSVTSSHQLQQENVDRAQRIAALLDDDLAALKEPPVAGEAAPGQPAADPAAQQPAERERLDLAKKSLESAKQEMSAAREALAGVVEKSKPAKPSDSAPAGSNSKTPRGEPALDEAALAPSRKHVEQALAHLQDLRRLFFSIVDHLRETAQRQAQLNDETERVAVIGDKEKLAEKTGPLATRQDELRTTSEQIAAALDEQAKQPPAGAADPQQADPKQVEQMQEIAERLGKAAGLVAEGGKAMRKAGEAMVVAEPHVEAAEKAKDQASKKPVEDPTGQDQASEEPSQTQTGQDQASKKLGEARTNQDQALQKLVEALALLQPPQAGEQNKPDQPQQGENQQQPQQGGQDRQESGEMGADPSRLLQAIRDREAERRRDRQQRQRFQQEPVEKDW